MILKLAFREPRARTRPTDDSLARWSTPAGPDGPVETVTHEKWIDGVDSVETLDQRIWRSHAEVAAVLGSDTSVYMWLPPGGDHEVTELDKLLASEFDGQVGTHMIVYHARQPRIGDGRGYSYWLVEQAWLLNDRGDTIERIAP